MILIYSIAIGIAVTAAICIVFLIAFAIVDKICEETIYAEENRRKENEDKQFWTELRIYAANIRTLNYLKDMIPVLELVEQYDKDDAENLLNCLRVIADNIVREDDEY